MDGIAIKVEENIVTALRKFKASVIRRIIRGALRRSTKNMQKLAVSLAPVLSNPRPYRTPGVLKNNIVVRPSKKARGTTLGIYIGIKTRKGGASAKDPLNPFYGRFVELGHRIVARKAAKGGTGSFKGFVAGRFFLRRAFEAFAASVPALFSKYLDTAVSKEMKKVK